MRIKYAKILRFYTNFILVLRFCIVYFCGSFLFPSYGGADRSYFRLSFNGQKTGFFSFSMASSIGLRVGKVVCRAISLFKRL